MIAVAAVSRLWRRFGPLAVVGGAVLFGAVLLRFDLFSALPEKTDRVLHDSLVRECAASWGLEFPPDFWFRPLTGGYPMFAHYQPLSHLTAVAVAKIARLDAVRTYHALSGLLLILVPVAVYASLRRLGFSPWGSAIAAAIYPLVRTRPYFGIGWESYLTAGSGLLPQLWATFFLFPALAWGWTAVRGEGPHTDRRAAARAIVAAALLLAACALTHTIFGYAVAVSLGLAACIPDRRGGWRGRVVRLGLVGIGTALLTIWFALPLAALSKEALRSQWEFSWKWNSIGLPAVLSALFRGELFDAPSVPIVSLLVAAGLIAALNRAVRHQDALARYVVLGFAAWIALFAGRATWGRLIDVVLPLSSGLHMHRFVALVQVFGLVAAAFAVDAAVRWAAAGRGIRRGLVLTALLIGALAYPAVERVRFVAENDRIAASRRAALEADAHLHEALAYLRERPPGRVYAGLHHDWGASATVGDLPLYSVAQSAGFDMVGYPFAAMAFPAEWLVRADFSRREHLDLFAARWILAPHGAPLSSAAISRARFGRWEVLEVPEVSYFDLGRVDAVPVDRPFRSWAEVYEAGRAWMFGPGPETGRYAAFFSPSPESIDGEVRGEIVEEQVAAGLFGATVRLDTAGDLILKATKHPWWRCTVDGAAARITPVFPGFQSVRLAPGTHRVEFHYAPPAWKRGLFALALITALTGLSWLGWDAVRRLRTRTQREAESSADGGSSRPTGYRR